jgi:hypothetical protein
LFASEYLLYSGETSGGSSWYIEKEFFLYSLSQDGSLFAAEISSIWFEPSVDKANNAMPNHKS